MRAFTAAGLALATLCSVTAMRAGAADLSPLLPTAPAYAEPDAQYEFGTGWYLRGDASFEPADHPVLDVTSLDFKKRGWDYALGGGIGYKFTSFLRADVTGDYFDPIATSASPAPNTDAHATLRRYDAMANLYVDLGDWYGFTPYVGGGVGVGIFDPAGKVKLTGPTGTTTVARPSLDTQSKLAWAAMAGFSYQVDNNIAVDVGYRHLDLGRFATTLAGYTIDHHFAEDQVRVGLRYMVY